MIRASFCSFEWFRYPSCRSCGVKHVDRVASEYIKRLLIHSDSCDWIRKCKFVWTCRIVVIEVQSYTFIEFCRVIRVSTYPSTIRKIHSKRRFKVCYTTCWNSISRSRELSVSINAIHTVHGRVTIQEVHFAFTRNVCSSNYRRLCSCTIHWDQIVSSIVLISCKKWLWRHWRYIACKPKSLWTCTW